MIDVGTELVELHVRPGGGPVTVSSTTSKPVVLILYGDGGNWSIAEDSKNIKAIFVYGKDATLRSPEKMQIPTYPDTRLNAYPEPWGSSFNSYTGTIIGLNIGAMVDSTSRPYTQLDDAMLSGLPRCEGRVLTNCRTH